MRQHDARPERAGSFLSGGDAAGQGQWRPKACARPGGLFVEDILGGVEIAAFGQADGHHGVLHLVAVGHADAVQQLVDVHGFLKEVVGAHAVGRLFFGITAVTGQDDDLHLGVALLDAAQHFETVHAGHAQVQDDDVGGLFNGFEGLRAVIGHAR